MYGFIRHGNLHQIKSSLACDCFIVAVVLVNWFRLSFLKHIFDMW
jgi:hypothetical protein